jgi:hypothetical protein
MTRAVLACSSVAVGRCAAWFAWWEELEGADVCRLLPRSRSFLRLVRGPRCLRYNCSFCSSVPDEQDILLDKDFDELFIKPESRRAQFQPDNDTQVPQDVPQELEAPDYPSDDGNRRSQRSRTTTQRYAPIDYVGFAANRLELQRHAAMHTNILSAHL